MELQREGKTWLRRQEVPPHGFVTREEVERWTTAHGNCDIISVSHVWETRDHPDPLGFQLDRVLEILGEKGKVCHYFKKDKSKPNKSNQIIQSKILHPSSVLEVVAHVLCENGNDANVVGRITVVDAVFCLCDTYCT